MPGPAYHGRTHVKGGTDPIPGIATSQTGTPSEVVLGVVPGAYYKLDETSGDWADSSGASRTLTHTSRTGEVRGVDSEFDEDDGSLAVEVDGGTTGSTTALYVGSRSDSFFRFAALAAMTVSARVKLEANPTGGVWSWGVCGSINNGAAAGFETSGWGMFVQSDTRKPFFYRRNQTGPTTDTVVSSAALPAAASDTWTRVTCTFDGTTMRVFVGASLVGSGAAAASLQNNSALDNFFVGSCGIAEGVGGRWAPFRGDIDSVIVVNRALAPSEVAAIDQSGGFALENAVLTSDGEGGTFWAKPKITVSW